MFITNVLKSIRPVAKKLVQESHPFFIYPTTAKAAPIQMRFYTTRLARAGALYIPGYVAFFGWPLGAKALVTATGGP
ncbi:hypothetical protein RUND412_003508 [Rhizina undulata]